MIENQRPEGLMAGSGQKIEPKALQQMVSVRLDGELIAALRAHAHKAGMSLSDLLRIAVTRYLGELAEGQTLTVHWIVTNGTRSNVPISREFDTVADAS